MKTLALVLLALVLMGCSEETASTVSPSEQRCAAIAEWQCRCDAGADAKRAAQCIDYTVSLCLDYPNLQEWSASCESALAELACPLNGPIPEVCSYATGDPTN